MSARKSPPRATARLRRAPLTRSSSLLGTLKSFVAAPLTWFASADDVHDTPGEKRQRRVQHTDDVDALDADEEAERKSKRKRIHSPEPETRPLPQYQPQKSGYLDPPQSLLGKRPSLPANAPVASSSYVRSSTALPSTSTRHHNRNRLSLSPRPSTAHGKQTGIARTQSMDPPGRLLVPPRSTRPPPISRDASMMSIDDPRSSPTSSVGDVPMSPSRPRFRLRTSLTPQPSGSEFGPSQVRRERDPSEAPPLESLMENPVFVKGPRNTEPPQRQASLTLGSLAETHKGAQPLTRQRSNLTIGSSSESYKNGIRPINAAELALQELEVYKTPLLPSRIRGSAALPDMFRPKKAAQRALLMQADRDGRPRLGLSDSQGISIGEESSKGKKGKGVAAKPYEGQGGMKKLLARRRMEEVEEKEKEKDSAIETDEEGADDREKRAAVEKLVKGLESTPESAPESGSRSQSTLRVGRTRTNRSHLPTAKPKPKNRFSAVYEDEEGDDAMSLGGVEAEADAPSRAAATESIYEPPKGFSFANAAPIRHDVSTAKEPPIAALPFSLTAKPAASTPAPAPAAAASVTVTPAPAFPSVPSISLIPPSPASAEKEKEKATSTSTPSGSVPNFFANSAILNKPSAQLPFSLTPTPAAAPTPQSAGMFSWGAPSEKSEAAPSSLFGVPASDSSNAEASKAGSSTLAPSLFPATDPSNPVSPMFGAVEARTLKGVHLGPAKPDARPTPPLFSGLDPNAPLFGRAPPANADKDAAPSNSAFSFGAPPKAVETFVSPTAAATAAPAPTPSPFSFGAPAKSEELKAAPAPAASPFSFGAPAKVETKTESGDTPKPPAPSSLFPTSLSAPAPLFTGFGTQSGSTASSPVEASKSPFSFGQATATTVTPSTSAPTIEAPKPLFGSATAPPATPTSPFSFGAPTSAVNEAPTPVKSPFTFGSSAPSTPNPEKQTSTFLFGSSTSGTNSTDVSKTFAFGTSTPVRPVTPPPRNDNEVNMDESPMRGGGMDVNNSTPAKLTAFGFGGPSSSTASPFGQQQEKPTLTFGGFGQQSSSASSNPFGFGSSTSIQQPTSATSSSGGFGGFGGGASASTPTSTSSPFSFGGAPAAPASNNLFGQPSSASTTPASPTFPQPASSFSFGALAAPPSIPSNPFGFSGSQPASPAGSNAGLPSGGGFSFGGNSGASNGNGSPSPFGGNVPLPPVTGGGAPAAGGALFTMGSAPPAGARPVKKMPSRRGGKR